MLAYGRGTERGHARPKIKPHRQVCCGRQAKRHSNRLFRRQVHRPCAPRCQQWRASLVCLLHLATRRQTRPGPIRALPPKALKITRKWLCVCALRRACSSRDGTTEVGNSSATTPNAALPRCPELDLALEQVYSWRAVFQGFDAGQSDAGKLSIAYTHPTPPPRHGRFMYGIRL